MPNIKSAAKRAKQAEVRRLRNRSTNSAIASVRRSLVAAVESKNKAEATQAFNAFASILDKSVKRGIVPKNTADRKKSRAAAMLKKMA
jgi:small subunit ribosomal protein S20